MELENDDRPTVIYPIDADPISFGEIYNIMQVEDKFRKIFIVIRDYPKLLETERAVQMLQFILNKLSSKIHVISDKTDFKETSYYPKALPEVDGIVTASVEIYINLITKGFKNVLLVPKLIGYEQFYMRTMYERSILLDTIKGKMQVQNVKI
jgi:hypothetical protein